MFFNLLKQIYQYSYYQRPSMSHGTGLGLERNLERDFVLATTEEFVKRFGGNRVSTISQNLN